MNANLAGATRGLENKLAQLRISPMGRRKQIAAIFFWTPKFQLNGPKQTDRRVRDNPFVA
jgi:hypothetical protein